MKSELKLFIKNNKVRDVVLGLAGGISLSMSLPVSHLVGRDGVVYSNTFHSLLFCVCITTLYCFMCKELRNHSFKGRNVPGLPSLPFITNFPGIIFSFFLVVGEQLETSDNFNFLSIVSYGKIVFISIFLSCLVEYLWLLLDKYEGNLIKNKDDVIIDAASVMRKGKDRENKRKKELFRNSLIIFLSWLPVFLAFYPGAFVYDAFDEYNQVKTGEYTTHHPLLHVLMLGKSVVWGEEFLKSANLGIAFYTIFQMILLAIIFAYIIEILKKFKIKSWVENICVAFYSLFPLFPMYAVCSSKDTLFTAFLLLLFIEVVQFTENNDDFYSKKRKRLLLVFAALFMMLFRNNGSYAYLVWLVAGIGSSFLRKNVKNRKKIIIMLILPVFLWLGISNYLSSALNASPGGKQEIMTVPIQQLARTYHYAPEVFNEEDLQTLYEILPEEELNLYTPRISDLLKSKFNNENFRENPVKYLALWFKTGLKKPLIYVNAWLLTSYGYWYPDAVINVYGGNARHTIVYEDSSYFGFETEPPGVRESKFPLLEKHFRKMSLDLYQQRIPGISCVFSPGFLFWVFLFYFCYGIRKKEAGRIISMSIILFLWMTVLLGPTYLVRYVLILWFALPVIIIPYKSSIISSGK